MVVLQPQRLVRILVRIGLLLVPLLGCCLLLGAEGQQQQAPKKAADRAAELKALLKERQDTVSRLVDQLAAQHQAGVPEVGKVAQALRELLKATVDLEAGPEKRDATLRKARDMLKEMARMPNTINVDVAQATVSLVGAWTELLREELKSQPRK